MKYISQSPCSSLFCLGRWSQIAKAKIHSQFIGVITQNVSLIFLSHCLGLLDRSFSVVHQSYSLLEQSFKYTSTLVYAHLPSRSYRGRTSLRSTHQSGQYRIFLICEDLVTGFLVPQGSRFLPLWTSTNSYRTTFHPTMRCLRNLVTLARRSATKKSKQRF